MLILTNEFIIVTHMRDALQNILIRDPITV